AGSISSSISTGELYRRCRRVDEAAAWLLRLWEFYRDKFDQRDVRPSQSDADMTVSAEVGARDASDVRVPFAGPTLRAADQIVWSAYHRVMSMAEALSNVAHGSAPLPFVAPEYSPSALDTQRPLASHLKLYLTFPTFNPRLKALVDRLAVPLLALPPWF